MLDLGEGLLDRIEVGRVLRQEEQPGAGRPERLANRLGLVTAEIVHDDDVARLQGGDEELFDIGPEAGAVDRTFEHAGRGKLLAAQGGEEGHGVPAALGRKAPQAPALRPPAPKWRHVGSNPGLIDKDQAMRIEPVLPGLPAPAMARHIGPPLLKREQAFF